VEAPLLLPPSPVPDFIGAVSLVPPQDGGGALSVNLAWDVEQVLSSGRHRYRVRLTNSQLDDAKPELAGLMPDDDAAGAWMSPADAARRHGIGIHRR
jgi:hypothetical protein